MRYAWIVLLCSLALGVPFGQARACIWDRDTLATEARGKPSLIDVALGRVDRWPDEVYVQRLAAVEAELATSPDRLDLYDDAGVACDRLGRYDQSLEWMQRKRAALERLDEHDPLRVEHEYRFLANRGTFHMHRWIATGADRDNMADVVRAEEDIAAAIELNPDAHFGREIVQLAVIRRVLHPPSGATGSDEPYHNTFLFSFTANRPSRSTTPSLQLFDDTEMPTEDLIEGLAGLITLGAAWQSVDIYASLSIAIAANGDNAIAELVAERARRLISDGRPSLFYPDDDTESLAERAPLYTMAQNRDAIVRFAERGAAWATQVNTARNAYIRDRLRDGQHPDSDPEFMAGFTPTRRPNMPSFTPPEPATVGALFILFALFTLTLVAAFKYMRR